MWKFYQCPTKVENEVRRFTKNIIKPYAIMSKDRQTVLIFGEEIFKYCSLPRYNYHYCFPVIMMRPTNLTLCAKSILRQERIVRCEISKFDDPVIRWIKNERYLSLHEPQKTALICKGKDPQEKWLSEASKIAAPCEMKILNSNIPSLRTLHKTINYKIVSLNLTVPKTYIEPNEDKIGSIE